MARAAEAENEDADKYAPNADKQDKNGYHARGHRGQQRGCTSENRAVGNNIYDLEDAYAEAYECYNCSYHFKHIISIIIQLVEG